MGTNTECVTLPRINTPSLNKQVLLLPGPAQSSAIPLAKTQAAPDLLQKEKGKRGDGLQQNWPQQRVKVLALGWVCQSTPGCLQTWLPEKMWDTWWRHFPRDMQLLWVRGCIPGAVAPPRQEVDSSTKTPEELSTCPWWDLVPPAPQRQMGEINSPGGFARCLGGR